MIFGQAFSRSAIGRLEPERWKRPMSRVGTELLAPGEIEWLSNRPIGVQLLWPFHRASQMAATWEGIARLKEKLPGSDWSRFWNKPRPLGGWQLLDNCDARSECHGPLDRRSTLTLGERDRCLICGVRCRKPQRCFFSKVEDVRVQPDDFGLNVFGPKNASPSDWCPRVWSRGRDRKR